MSLSRAYAGVVGLAVSLSLLIVTASADGTHFLYDIVSDPTEASSVYSARRYKSQVATMEERLDYWETKVIPAQVAAKTNKVEAWYAAGGVQPWLETDFEPVAVEQIYSNSEAPHIIFVLVDDWGYNDFGQRSTYLSWTTPHVDSLASEGLMLSNYFTHEVCTPSRGALLTGKYALRLGMMEQHEMAELPLHEITMAQEMKSAGYRTYMVGKWHLGISTVKHWPTQRGFDSFYGFVNGDVNYWTKNYGDHLDLQDNEDLVTDPDEIDTSLHNGYLLQAKAEKAIKDHAENYPEDPMFLYYSMQLIHAPWSAPDEFVARCQSDDNYLVAQSAPDDYVDSVELNYCAMNLMMDEVIANLTCTLESYHMRENTYLIISGDNGGEGTVPGNSYPYRGHKGSYWRGGVSNTAFIHSPLLSKNLRGKVYDGYMHISGK
jgi:arylsulfatase A-like enzyme